MESQAAPFLDTEGVRKRKIAIPERERQAPERLALPASGTNTMLSKYVTGGRADTPHARRRVWGRLEKGARAEEFTFPGDPMRIDYGYGRARVGAKNIERVARARGSKICSLYRGAHPRLTAVTDVHLIQEKERHKFVQETLRHAGVEAVPLQRFAVWTLKLRPIVQ